MLQIKDTYISLKKIRKISYINNYKGFSDNNYIVILYEDDKELYIKMKDKSEYEYYSNLLAEKIGGSKKWKIII